MMSTVEPSPPSVDALSQLSLPQLCGQLLVVGFEGSSIPQDLACDLAAGLRAGVILFRHNMPSLTSTWKLTRQIVSSVDSRLPPLICIDQEGGRVTRLPEPISALPSMRRLGALHDAQLIERAAETVGRGLCTLGINCNFAPVLDVDSNPSNPVIGDRSFSNRPHDVAHLGLAFANGLRRGGVLACGKHFPGHGDTSRDSHSELPIVAKSLAELEDVELIPFREAAATSIGSLMTAHVLYKCLDNSQPATLSQLIITDLLRAQWGYDGLVISDDLQMGAIANSYSTGVAAVLAIRAGCDMLLICHDRTGAEQALDALVTEAEDNPAFSDRVYQAARRSLAARHAYTPRPAAQLVDAEHVLLGSMLKAAASRR